MYKGKRLSSILIILGVIIILMSVVCYFLFQDIKQKNENYHNLLYKLLFQNDKKAYLESSGKIVNSLSPEIDLINSSMVSKEGQVDFIENIENIARGVGLSIEIDSLIYKNDLKFASSSIDIFKIKAKTKGSWVNNYIFLARIESLPVKVKINKLSLIKMLGEVPADNYWQATYEIDVLKYK